jgi:hypothetical protein
MVSLLALGWLALSAQAQLESPEKVAASLRFVPADAAGYSVMLRNGEAWKAVAKSKAWAKLMALPSVKEAMGKALAPGSPLVPLLNHKEEIALAGELLSDEVFTLSGKSASEFAGLMAELQGARFAGQLAQLKGGDPNKAQLVALLTALKDNKDKLKAPDILIGFRTASPARATAVRKMLTDRLEKLVDSQAVTKGRLKEGKVGDSSVAVLRLDGSMVPWDKIPLADFEQKEGEYKPLIDHLKKQVVTLALGTREEFVLFSIGETPKLIKTLGGAKLLAGLPEFKPLANFADRKLTSISYASKAVNALGQTTGQNVAEAVKGLREMLQGLQLTEKQKKEMEKDLAELAKDMRSTVPEVGASLSFGFWSERGGESYSYDWTRYPGARAPKPLALWNHLGGDPLIAAVGRAPNMAENYAGLVKWLGRAEYWAEELGLPLLEPEQRDLVKQLQKALHPLLKQMSDTTAKMTIPSLAGGEWAFVLDAKLMSKQWVQAIPEAKQPLPMVELAVVLALKNPALLEKALGEYRVTTNAILKQITQITNAGIDLEIPKAKTRELKTGGKLFFYAAPENAGLDPQLALTAGIGKKAAVFTLSPVTAERLLAEKPLKADHLRGFKDKPLESAGILDWEGIVRAARPWVDMAVEQYTGEEGKGPETIRGQVGVVMDVLSVFRRVTSVTYPEGKATVTHSLAVFQDLK